MTTINREIIESKLEWLGKIPKGWSEKRLRFLITTNPSKSEIEIDFSEDASFVPMEAVREYGGMRLDMTKPIEDVMNGYTYFKDKDVVVAKITPCFENGKGSIAEGLHNGIAFGTTEFHVLRPDKEIDHRYLFYISTSHPFRKIGEANMYGAGGQKRISDRFIKDFLFPFPHLSEQTQIANFLDQKTGQIDRLIAQKEKLLKLLAEKRTAIITQAVTKGLDPNVEMKDSGIDWLGEIPKHWIPKRLKFLTDKIIDGTHSTPEYLSEGVPFLRVTDIVKANGDNLNESAFKYISQEEHEELIKRCKPEKGDLLYSKNGTIGIPRVVDWDFDFSIFVSLCLIKIKKDLLIPSFLKYSLQSKLTENQISIGSKKSAVINLHLDKIKEFVIPYPPMVEQIQINNWLNEILPKYHRSEKKLAESIQQLKEYREAIITAAVTGQIDVRKEVLNEQAY